MKSLLLSIVFILCFSEASMAYCYEPTAPSPPATYTKPTMPSKPSKPFCINEFAGTLHVTTGRYSHTILIQIDTNRSIASSEMMSRITLVSSKTCSQRWTHFQMMLVHMLNARQTVFSINYQSNGPVAYSYIDYHAIP